MILLIPKHLFGKKKSVLINMLREDALPIPRSGAIAIGGLAGVVLGLRGGWIKRIIYGSTCAGLLTAVCYPQEVSEISQQTLATTKKYIHITYNFVYGVKPESLVLPSPSQLLGGSIESTDTGKSETKSATPAVSEEKPETPVRTRKSSNDPSCQGQMKNPCENLSAVPQENPDICPNYQEHSCKKLEQDKEAKAK